MNRCLAISSVLTLAIFVGPLPADEVGQALQLARNTLDFVQQGAARPKLAEELAALEDRAVKRPREEAADSDELVAEIRRLRRKIILSHPLLDFDKLLINKRPPPGYSHQSRQYLGRYSQAGPGLVVLESWKDNPRETVLLQGKLPAGSVLNPDLSFDGKRVLFSFCEHTVADPELRRFHIYEVGIDGTGLRQLTGTPADPMAGAEGRQTALVEDFDPCYLPDGGFAFVSTRVQTHIRCQYGGRYFANFLLYRADGDGSNIRPLSFGEAPEWEPSVLPDGRILYTRWDYINRHDTLFQSLWVTRPDGTATGHVYGNYTRNPCVTAEPRAVPGSHKMVATAAAHHCYTAGSIIVVDPQQGSEGEAPLTRITPEIEFPETEGWPQGAFANPYPLSEDLFLVAYTPEQLVKEGKVQSANAYGIYLIDTLGGREFIFRDAEVSCMSPIPVRPREKPPVPAPLEASAVETTGVFYVQNVYRSTAEIPRGSVKSLRVVKVFGQPIETPPSRSMVLFETPKRILGIVPVAEDGSVAFRAPAGEPLLFQLLDKHGMSVMSMRSLVYLQPGEAIGCVGCHEPRNSTTHRPGLPGDVTVRDLQPPAGPRYEGGFSFARTVQPVLDRYCITCHGLDRTDGEIDLLGTLREVTFPYQGWPGPNRIVVSRAYESLVTREGLIRLAQRNLETDYSLPKDYFSHASRLPGMLLDGHPDPEGKARVELDRESFQRIVDWLDLNAVFYGDYSWNKAEWRRARPDAESALRKHIRETLGQDVAGQPFAALVNVGLPSESRILKAPLAQAAGGWGQFGAGGWTSEDDAGYRKMCQMVEAAIAPLPYHDLAGTCAQDKCLCDSCWVRHVRDGQTGRTQSAEQR